VFLLMPNRSLTTRRVRRNPHRLQSLEQLAVAPTLKLPLRARILGLDPGSRVTGFAVLDCEGAQISYVTSGSIRTEGEQFTDRLRHVFTGLAEIVAQFLPDEIAIEKVFMHRNADSALKLGQARGVALSATFTQTSNVFEYAAREVKQAVVGTGAAEKTQVQLMVKRLLKLEGRLGADAADALAIALCHAHTRRLQNVLSASGSRR